MARTGIRITSRSRSSPPPRSSRRPRTLRIGARCRRIRLEALLSPGRRPPWAAYQAAFKTPDSTVDGSRAGHALARMGAHHRHRHARLWPTVWQAVCVTTRKSAYERLGGLSPEHHEALWGCQTFYRVFSTVNGGRARETHLFEGFKR